MILALLLKWVLFTIIVLFTAWLIPGIHVNNYATAFIVAAIISLINVSIKPILGFITFPINLFTLGLFSLVINALLLMFVGYLVNGFEVSGFWPAFFGAILMALLSLGLTFV